MKKLTRESIQVDVNDFGKDKNIEVCEWWNGEGIDISVCFDSTISMYSFTYREFEGIQAIVSILRSGVEIDEE